MWMHNRIHTIPIEVYNQSERIRGTGGIAQITESEHITLRVTWIPPINRFRQVEQGNFIEEKIVFQVSISELRKKSFTLIVGRTHIIKDGNNYRLSFIEDGSYMNTLQSRECVAIRKIPVEDFT